MSFSERGRTGSTRPCPAKRTIGIVAAIMAGVLGAAHQDQ